MGQITLRLSSQMEILRATVSSRSLPPDSEPEDQSQLNSFYPVVAFSADFANGWNTTVLQQVVTQCVDTDFSLPANKACPALNPSWSTSVRDSCFLEKTSLIPAESVRRRQGS